MCSQAIILKKLAYSRLSAYLLSSRCISTGSILFGKRNFRKFHFPNRRGTRYDKEYLRTHPEEVDRRGVRDYGYYDEEFKFHIIPELVPELIVPNLEGFKLKPYVSYRTEDITQEKFTPEHLFNCVYAAKIKKDYEAGLLDENGNPKEPSEAEKMTEDEARCKIKQTGSDLFG